MGFPDNLLSLAEPFSSTVWICFLTCIPTFFGVMCLLNYIYGGSGNWEAASGFVLRSALSEHMETKLDKHMYQKILVIVWAWTTLIIITAYTENLIAIITRPKLSMPFESAYEMIKQNKIF